MSKCRPKITEALAALERKGIHIEDTLTRPHVDSTTEERREIIIRIPYALLLSDAEVQALFQDLVSITNEDR